MVIRPKNIILPLFVLFFSWASWSTYSYLFDLSEPELTVNGLADGGYCAGDMICTIKGKDDYEVSEISVWIDNHLLVNKFKINKKEFEHPLPLPTKSLPNGRHILKIEVVDGAYKRNKVVKEINFNVDNIPLQAAFVNPSPEYKVFQGRTLHLQFQVNKPIKEARIKLLSKSFECFAESEGSTVYECFVPISCEELPNEYPLAVEIEDFAGKSLTLEGKFQIMPFPFKKQILNIASEKIKDEEEIGIKQQILEEELEALVKNSPRKKMWQGEFYMPLEMTRISCEYGTKRVTQQKGCYMHKAIDVIGLPKTVVWAPQDGIIVIKNRYVQSGNTIVIDHGWGVFSLLFHLDKFADVNVGDKVKKGSPIGTMGKTGYATGYHLHLEMRIGNIHVDPMQWIKYDF